MTTYALESTSKFCIEKVTKNQKFLWWIETVIYRKWMGCKYLKPNFLLKMKFEQLLWFLIIGMPQKTLHSSQQNPLALVPKIFFLSLHMQKKQDNSLKHSRFQLLQIVQWISRQVQKSNHALWTAGLRKRSIYLPVTILVYLQDQGFLGSTPNQEHQLLFCQCVSGF